MLVPSELETRFLLTEQITTRTGQSAMGVEFQVVVRERGQDSAILTGKAAVAIGSNVRQETDPQRDIPSGRDPGVGGGA